MSVGMLEDGSVPFFCAGIYPTVSHGKVLYNLLGFLARVERGLG
ncbi:hypothetical protein SLEP1_g59075 [Rubroshorea leprosula]|uniref:Uncharacterized protein n=1 Tax=Rubroshorea leprosula TaxID=152421 RepID=A0AAV5MTR1_9ROSI|nr:hypothetical protein SLEP1_g59075 [Rubroshorea leprosula]